MSPSQKPKQANKNTKIQMLTICKQFRILAVFLIIKSGKINVREYRCGNQKRFIGDRGQHLPKNEKLHCHLRNPYMNQAASS
jgi:hypothetical protein